jgi:hypothetical protein
VYVRGLVPMVTCNVPDASSQLLRLHVTLPAETVVLVHVVPLKSPLSLTVGLAPSAYPTTSNDNVVVSAEIALDVSVMTGPTEKRSTALVLAVDAPVTVTLTEVTTGVAGGVKLQVTELLAVAVMLQMYEFVRVTEVVPNKQEPLTETDAGMLFASKTELPAVTTGLMECRRTPLGYERVTPSTVILERYTLPAIVGLG